MLGRLSTILSVSRPLSSDEATTPTKVGSRENYLLQKFARAVIKTNNVDHCARL